MTSAEARPDGNDLRAVMTDFATGIVIATTRTGDEDHAVTLNSLTSVSLDPPLVLVSLGVTSRFAAQVRESGIWGLSILPEDGEAVARHFAGRDRTSSALAELAHHRGRTGVVLLDDALATLECRTQDIHRAGDHDIVVGLVVATEPGGPADGTGRPRPPLVGFRGAFGGFTP